MTAEPKEIGFGYANDSGIKIVFIKRRQVLDIYGWYDGMVGIEGAEISLREFLTRLGITLPMVKKALDEPTEQGE